MNEQVTTSEMRAKAASIEDTIRRELPLLDLKVVHHFGGGIYARELHIPAGTVLTGKIHKTENMNIMSRGELSVLTEDGVKRVKAPFTVVSPPGTKRVAYAHEDTVWTTLHATNERDVEKIESVFIAQDEHEFLTYCKSLEET